MNIHNCKAYITLITTNTNSVMTSLLGIIYSNTYHRYESDVHGNDDRDSQCKRSSNVAELYVSYRHTRQDIIQCILQRSRRNGFPYPHLP